MFPAQYYGRAGDFKRSRYSGSRKNFLLQASGGYPPHRASRRRKAGLMLGDAVFIG